jgi:antitoxin component YwqK of YwqJK toxin-antitoxin module
MAASQPFYQNMQRISYLIATFFLALVACNRTHETIDRKDDAGYRELFSERKKDGVKDGRYQKFHPNGTTAEEAHYTDGQLNGERKFFFANGNIEIIEQHRQGVYDGKYQKYFENGVLYVEQQFVNGAMQGQSLKYYPNGVLEEKVTIRDNNENGPFTEYYQNGNRRAEGTYQDGAYEQGELKEYDESGQLVRIADCNKGACTTRWRKE